MRIVLLHDEPHRRFSICRKYTNPSGKVARYSHFILVQPHELLITNEAKTCTVLGGRGGEGA